MKEKRQYDMIQTKKRKICMERIILASASPRRKELMTMAGLNFDVIVSDCDENISYDGPEDMVKQLSLRKAQNVAEKIQKTQKEPHLVIGSDTIVYFENHILGKPKDADDAFRMLTSMAGKCHAVYTGVTILDTGTDRCETFCETTQVEFYDVSAQEIKDYIATGDPLDKAGSYGVQGRGAFLVKRIEGDYFTVVGLPIAHLIRELKAF